MDEPLLKNQQRQLLHMRFLQLLAIPMTVAEEISWKKLFDDMDVDKVEMIINILEYVTKVQIERDPHHGNKGRHKAENISKNIM